MASAHHITFILETHDRGIAAALLLDGAVGQFETLRQHHAGIDLQSHAARAVIDRPAAGMQAGRPLNERRAST